MMFLFFLHLVGVDEDTAITEPMLVIPRCAKENIGYIAFIVILNWTLIFTCLYNDLNYIAFSLSSVLSNKEHAFKDWIAEKNYPITQMMYDKYANGKLQGQVRTLILFPGANSNSNPIF